MQSSKCLGLHHSAMADHALNWLPGVTTVEPDRSIEYGEYGASFASAGYTLTER